MPWFGPCGTCGCDGGGCTCPSPCECREGFSGGPLLGYVSGHTLTLSGFPAVMEYTAPAGTVVLLRLYGFEQLNGTYELPANPSFSCYTNTIASFTVTAVESSCSVTGTVTLAFNGSDFIVLLSDGDRFHTVTCGCNTSNDLNLFNLSLFDFPAGTCFGFPEGTATDSFPKFNCSGFELDNGPFTITGELSTQVSNSSAIPHLGWNYNVSNVPSSFYLRISNGVKSYQITGMDVLNGDYELELDDESDCSKSGIEFLSFDITAQEFQISTSSPCTIVPVGSTVAATARLALPPTSTGVVVTIRIPGENDKSILIDDWVPFGCEAYSDDAYIDHELTECFGNPDPILTLSKTAILG